jgi:methylated-DNA-[protein]-cysteine S-methyltransferase
VPPFYVASEIAPIGWGATATMATLARAGSRAARAVGQAMARNPVPIVIPCHRVLASGRKIGGFSAFGGTVTKERLLALEGVSLLADAPLLAALEEAPIKISADSRS